MKNKIYRLSFLFFVLCIIVFLLLSSFPTHKINHVCHGEDCTLCTITEALRAFSALSLLSLLSYVIIAVSEHRREKTENPIANNNSLLSLVKRKVKLSD